MNSKFACATCNHCDLCNKYYIEYHKFDKHNKSVYHQKRVDQRKLLELSLTNNKNKRCMELKNRKGKVVGIAIMDKPVYEHILLNNYPVYQSKGYVFVQLK